MAEQIRYEDGSYSREYANDRVVPREQAAEVERTWPENAKPTPEQLAAYLAVMPRANLIADAETILDAMDRADECFVRNHTDRLERAEADAVNLRKVAAAAIRTIARVEALADWWGRRAGDDAYDVACRDHAAHLRAALGGDQ